MQQRSRRRMWVAFGMGALAALLTLADDASAQATQDGVTFSRDVAVILQENCQVCHQPGSIGPMSLMSYDEVRPWAPMIKEKVVTREMPPYHLEPDVGIQEIQQDWRLSEQEIETIATWVDAGAPEGNPADLPPPVEWPDYREWRFAEALGQPDLVIKTPEFDVPAAGGDLWFKPIIPSGLTEDRWIRAIEIKPSYPAGRSVVHHAVPGMRILNEDGTFESIGGLSEFAMGKVGEMMPADAGRKMPAGAYVSWDVHYYPQGTEVVGDQVELGLWFHPEGYVPPFEQKLENLGLQGDIALAPHGTAMTQGFHRWDHPVRIDQFQAHGHLRLVRMQMEAIYPDGEREILSNARFRATWHHSYIYEPDAAPLLPTGTVLVLTGWYDNTENNPLNPDPNVWAGRGARTTDEMSHAWIPITHLDEASFERLVAEREARKEAAQNAGDDGGD
jgi:mono/diheme cytochrome c family protein